MNVTCTADVCPIALNAKCVFYESSALPNTGIATNDSLQVALQKIDAVIATGGGGGNVDSVNGQTGIVVLTAADVGAAASGDNISIFTNDSGYITGAIADGDYWKTSGNTNIATLTAIVLNNNDANALQFKWFDSLNSVNCFIKIDTVEDVGFIGEGNIITFGTDGATGNPVLLKATHQPDISIGFDDLTYVTKKYVDDNVPTAGSGITEVVGAFNLGGTTTLADTILAPNVAGTQNFRIGNHFGLSYDNIFLSGERVHSYLNMDGTAVSFSVDDYAVYGGTGGGTRILGISTDASMRIASDLTSFRIIDASANTPLVVTAAGAALSAIPTAPTAAPGTNTDQIATTAFVTAAVGGGGGITNTAAANEMMKSDGTNAVPSGIFSTTAGNAILGTGLAGSIRTITSDGSAADVALGLITKGTGVIQTQSGGATLFTANGVASGTDVNVSTIYAGSGYINSVPYFRISNQTTGVAAVGIGAGMEFHVKTAAANWEIAGIIESVTTLLTSTNEYADLVFRSMGEGTLGEVMRLSKLAGPTTRMTVQAKTLDVTSTAWKFNGTTLVNGNLKVGVIGDETVDRRLHVEDNSSSTNTVLYALRLTRIVNPGNGAVGVGVGMEFETENGSGSNVVGSIIESVSTNVTAGTEAFDLVFKNMAAGAAAAEKVRITSTGNVGIGITPASKLHVQQIEASMPVTATDSQSVAKYTTSTVTGDDPICAIYQNRVTTTSGVPASLMIVAIPADTTVLIKALVVARRTGGAAGTAQDGAAYEISSAWKNIAGVATAIGAEIVTVIGEDQAGWNITQTNAGGVENVNVIVTGATDNDIVWSTADFRVIQVST